jgi:hypothetical protein
VLRIDSEKGEFHLAALKRKEKPDAVKKTKALIQSRLKRTDLVDLLIDVDNQTGDVTVSHSRRWSDFEEYLIPRPKWVKERAQHHAALDLPLGADGYAEEKRLSIFKGGLECCPDHIP